MKKIPLFPLPLVVLPGEPLLLHIFEDRYKDLLQDIREAGQANEFAEFGIVLSQEGRHVDVGTTVALTEVFDETEDGRLNIMVTGHLRFKIDAKDDSLTYEQARVSFINDISSDWDEEKGNRAFKLHREISAQVLGGYPADEVYEGQVQLSYLLAQSAGLDIEIRQKLIELPTENDRLDLLGDYFEVLLPEMQRIGQIKARARENWSLQEHLRGKR